MVATAPSRRRACATGGCVIETLDVGEATEASCPGRASHIGAGAQAVYGKAAAVSRAIADVAVGDRHHAGTHRVAPRPPHAARRCASPVPAVARRSGPG